MSDNWVDLLSSKGDPVEQMGIAKYGLGKTFPNYAEFWGKYRQYPNLETIFKYHYSVFYHLVVALHQNEHINEYPLLDIGSPFVHLATVIDLTYRVFITTLHETRRPLAEKLEGSIFDKRVNYYWE